MGTRGRRIGRLTLPRRPTHASLVALVVVAGCAAPHTVGGGKASAHASAPPPTPAPSEALAPAPSIRAGDDARTLLKPGGDQDLLAMKLADDLKALKSLHVEEHYNGDNHLSFSYDVDYGHCSGVGQDSGIHFRFLTTNDGRMLVTTTQGAFGQKLAGRWVEATGYSLTDSCAGGPLDVALSTRNGAGSWWVLTDATRVGVDRVAGKRAVHFRKAGDGLTIDTWVAADGPTTRLMKVVRRTDKGGVHTLELSQFDSADPVEPEPPADRVVKPGQDTA